MNDTPSPVDHLSARRLSPYQARDAARRLCAGLRKALAIRAEDDPTDRCDPRTDDGLMLLSIWCEECVPFGQFTLGRIRSDAARVASEHASTLSGSDTIIAAARALHDIVQLVMTGAESFVDSALTHIAPLLACWPCHDQCEAVSHAMGIDGTCADCSGLDTAFGGPLVRAARAASPTPRPTTQWPTVGIHGPGLWGSKDHLHWTHAPDGSLTLSSAPGGFKVGWTVESPEAARVTMRTNAEIFLREYLRHWNAP